MNYEIAVVDRVTAFVGDSRAVQHCVRGDTITVEFDTEWNDVEKTAAVFVNRADGTRKTIEMTTNTVTIPWEAMRTQGELYVTFIGYIGNLDASGIRLVTKLMDNPFIVERADVVDVVVPEATEDILHRIYNAGDEIDAATSKALAAAVRAEEAADLIGTSAVSRAEFDAVVNELAAVLANYVGRIWYLNRVLYVPEDIAEIVGDTMRIEATYDESAETLWVG